MEALFLHLVNMSLSASPLILLVILARLPLKRAPRWMVCLLWAVVALRLLCPFSLESPVGLMPSQPTVTEDQVNALIPGIVIPETGMPVAQMQPTAAVPAETVPEQLSVTQIASVIWAVGVAVMLLYLLVSYLRLRHMVREAVPLAPGILVCDGVATPFILGVIAPKIYLPSGIRKEDLAYVLAHERAHLKRKDHWWKILGFLLLSVYWFHPLVWVSYLLLSRDIELACDEKVIQNWNLEEKKAYSAALLACCSVRRLVFACPVAFGEVAVKERIRNVLHYKKPAFWGIAVSLAVILVGTICFMTTPSQPEAVVEQEVLAQWETQAPSAFTETVLPASAEEEWAEHPDGIRIESYTGETFTAQVMIVRNPAQVSLKLPSKSKQREEISLEGLLDTMAENGAVAGVNAGRYQYDSDTAGFAGFTREHILIVQKGNADEEQLEQWDIRDGVNVGPALIVNGEVNMDAYEISSGYTARTAIGQRADGGVIFICVNGRESDSLGCTYADVTDLMAAYGVVNACCLDSGFSLMARYDEAGQLQSLGSFPGDEEKALGGAKYWLVYPLQAD